MNKKCYPMPCAWCLAEGKQTVVAYSEVEGSHGMCQRHADEFLEQARKLAQRQKPR